MAGGELVLPGEDAVRSTAELGSIPGVISHLGDLAWPALLRKLDRSNPGYLQ